MSEKKYGWLPDIPDKNDHWTTDVFGVAPLPEQVSLRRGMPGIYDQRGTSSCVANAIAGCIEFDLRAQKIREFVPSRLFIYYNVRMLEGSEASDAGASIRDCVKTVASKGACSESPMPLDYETIWPWDVNKVLVAPPHACYSSALHHLVKTYARVPQDADSIKSVLAGGRPIAIGFTVYHAMESSEVARTGLLPMPSVVDLALGGHAVVIVGYDDNRKLFEVRNSWGKQWGDHGYFWMPYDYVVNNDLADDFWVINSIGPNS